MNELSVKQQNSPLFYRVNVKTFFDSDGDGIGDLNGLIGKFPFLVALGVNAVVLENLTESDNCGTTDYCRVSPAVGDLDDLSDFITLAHEQSAKVFLSLSPLCTSVSHPWFEKSSVSAGINPYREYYLWSNGKDAKGKTPPDQRKNAQGGSIWTHYQKTEWFQNVNNSGAPALNYDNPRVRKEMMEIVRFWAEKGVDGFVFDSPAFSVEGNADQSSKSLYTAGESVFGANAPFYRFLWEVKESFEVSVILNAMNGMDPKAYSYLLIGENPLVDHIIIDQPLNENPLSSKDFSLNRFMKEYHEAQWSKLADRLMLAFEDGAHGRLVSNFTKDPKLIYAASKLLSALLFSGVSTPILYQGEEIGMCALSKKDARPASTVPYQWDNRANGGFSQAAFPAFPVSDSYHYVNMVAEYTDPESPLSFCQKMISFRFAHDSLTEGTFEEYSKGNVIAFLRASSQEKLLIIANLTSDHLNFPVPASLLTRDAVCLMCSYSLVGKVLHESIGLRPFEARIYRL